MTSHYFLDSSALVKRFRRENGTEQVRLLIDSNNAIIISRLALVEVVAALARGSRLYASGVDVSAAVQTLDYYAQNRFVIIEFGLAQTFDYSIRLAIKHGLRASDSIQLACALIAKQTAGSNPFTLVSCDRELNAAAQMEGMAVDNPDMPTQH